MLYQFTIIVNDFPIFSHITELADPYYLSQKKFGDPSSKGEMYNHHTFSYSML